ncbi:LysR substrate-binding domain-containing protein [Roseobacteraceae bacterium NS-SX3]
MKTALPPLGWLRSFEAAARHLSFTGAARDLNMTQSAVSQQIKALEGYLAVALFHRRPRVLELTPAGTTYLPIVREAFRTLRMGTRAILGEQRDVVQVQANISFTVQWLSPRLGRFYDLHPDVLLNISTEIWEPQEMAEGADVEIRFSAGLSDTVRGELLRRDHYYPVCAPGYEVTLEDLHRHRLFDCSNLMCNFAAWADDQGLPWPNPPVTYATTYMACLPAVMAGAGVGMAHDIMAGDLIRQGRLAAPLSHRAEMPEAYYLMFSPQGEQSADARAFADWLRGEIAADGTGGRDWPEGFRS